MFDWISLAGGIIKGGIDIVKGWQKKKLAKQESELKINEAVSEAKIDRLRTRQQADIKWEDTAQRLSGLKDELMMFVIITPMVICFVPGGAEYIKVGFAAMKEALPKEWW